MDIQLTKKQLEQVEKHIIGDVWKTVSQEDFLRVINDKLCLGNTMLDDKYKITIREEAKTILSTKTWTMMINELTNISNRKMFEESKSWDDMVFGKACLYIIDVINKKLNNLAQLKIK
jgi:hypothetical protein